MKEEDTNNIYVYSEESDDKFVDKQGSDAPIDNSGPNYAQVDRNSVEYNIEDDSLENMVSFSVVFRLMLKVMLSPIEGWKSVRRAKITSEMAQRGCFYPLLAVLALSKFVVMAYYPSLSLANAMIDAVSSFVSFFFGYFCILIISKIVMPKAEYFQTNDFGKVLIVISLSTLSLFGTLTVLLPMLWSFMIFIPLWTIYIISRGAKFLK